MVNSNLLVTFDPVHEKSAKIEITVVLEKLKKKAKILKIEEGLVELSADNPREVVKALKNVDKEKFKYTFYWWPVDGWCKSNIENIKTSIKKIQKGIKQEEKWKMDLSKRKVTQKYPKDLIIKLTEVIDKPKVDLENPDKIIKVEIVSDRAAVSLLTPDEIFSVPKLKS